MSVRELLQDHGIDPRCPSCLCAWWLFEPVRIQQAGPPKVRCIECKDVFDEPTWMALKSAESKHD